jgi:hypothetical protein
MTLHDELIAEALDVLVEVQGTPAALTYLPPQGEPLVVDVVMLGQVEIVQEEDTLGGYERRERVEMRSVKIRGPFAGHLKARCLVAGDERPWDVDSVTGGETSVVTLKLKRPLVSAEGRASRQR